VILIAGGKLALEKVIGKMVQRRTSVSFKTLLRFHMSLRRCGSFQRAQWSNLGTMLLV